MRPCLLALSLLVLVGATRAEAESNAVALIWKGSRNKAEAEAQKPAWSSLEGTFKKLGVTFPEGHPRLIQSKTLPGLKPGYWVWLLGVCAPDDAPPIVDQLKLLSPETYSREVKVSPKQRACPRQEDEALGARDETLTQPSGATVRVFTHEEREDVAEHEGRWDYSTRTRYLFVLFGKGGEVLGSADAVGDEVVNKSGGGGPTSYRCDGTLLEKSGADTFVLTRHCDAGGAAECGSVASADEFVTVKVNSSAVFASTPQRINIQRAECD